MPSYEVRYDIPLTATQKDTIAATITHIHSQKFSTLKNFVNVKLIDVSDTDTYVGGRRRTSNMIFAHVRTGPSRTQADWDDLTAQLNQMWKDIVVNQPLPQAKGKPEPDRTLRGVFVIGSILGGSEAGMVLPAAGKDMEWLEGNFPEMQRRAEAGEREWKEVVEDVKGRGLLDGSGGAKVSDGPLAWGGWFDVNMKM